MDCCMLNRDPATVSIHLYSVPTAWLSSGVTKNHPNRCGVPRKVTLVTPAPVFGRNIGVSHADDFRRTVIPQLGIRLLPNTTLAQISQGRGHLVNHVTGEEIEEFFDFIVAGTPPRPRDVLFEVLGRHAPVTVVGDAVAPRDAMLAFREGDRAGRTI